MEMTKFLDTFLAEKFLELAYFNKTLYWLNVSGNEINISNNSGIVHKRVFSKS